MLDDNFFERLNLQSVVSFLLYGSEYTEIIDGTTLERIEKFQKEAMKGLKEFQNTVSSKNWKKLNLEQCQTKLEEFSESIIVNYGKSEDIHFELGIKVGFILATQLFCLKR